jgi:hypothetical protein
MAAKKPKANLFTFLRSGLRSLSRKHAPIYEALADAKTAYKGKPTDADYNPRQRFAYRCAMCHSEFPAKGVAIDHRVDCGRLANWDDVAGFMQRLFCDKSGLDVLCHTCHDAKTMATKQNITMEEAFLRKKVLAVIKDKSPEKLLAYLKTKGYYGASVSNKEKREAAVYEILKGETK